MNQPVTNPTQALESARFLPQEIIVSTWQAHMIDRWSNLQVALDECDPTSYRRFRTEYRHKTVKATRYIQYKPTSTGWAIDLSDFEKISPCPKWNPPTIEEFFRIIDTQNY